jgi:hypothetical protein
VAAKRSFWGSRTGRTAIAAALYLGFVVLVMALFNAGFSDAVFIWVAATFVLGWIMRNPWLALLPFLAVLIAAPFGYADVNEGGDPLPIWFGVLIEAPVLALIALAGCGARAFYERRSARRKRGGAPVTPTTDS